MTHTATTAIREGRYRNNYIRTEEDPQLSGKVPSYEPGVGQITALCALSVTWNSAVLIHFLLDSFSFIYAGSPGVIAACP